LQVGCPMLAYVEGGKILRIEPDPLARNDYVAKCEKLKIWPDLNERILYHPKRLNYPTKRAGRRGEGKWQRISWEQAIDEIAEKLKEIIDEYGPEAIALAQGTLYGDQDLGQYRFQCLLGTPNAWFQGKQCGGGRFPIEVAMYGYITFMGIPIPGLTKCIVFWGSDPENWWHRLELLDRIMTCKEAGAKLICIDPRATREAAISDLWLQIRPGSDAALAMAFLNVIIEEGLYDKEFVEKYTLGFDKLREAVKEMPPSRASKITWIPEDRIIEAARIIGNNRPVIWGGGGDYVTANHLGTANTAFSYYLYALFSLTGLDEPGGMYIWGNVDEICAYGKYVAMWKYLCEHPKRKRDTVGSDKYPIGSCRAWLRFYEAMKEVNSYGLECQYLTQPSHLAILDAIMTGKPYPIKALISQAGGLSAFPQKRLIEALKSDNLELFVVMDLFPSAYSALADYILPAAGALERDCLFTGNGIIFVITGSEKVFEPLYERHDDYDLYRDLGRKLGLDMPDKEKLFNMLLEPLRMTFKEFVHKKRVAMGEFRWRKYEKRLGTTSGKIEYVPAVLEDLFGKDVFPPKYEEPSLSPYKNPDLAKEYNLILTSRGRKWPYTHGSGRWIEEFREVYPYPLCEINSQDAAEHRIANGNWIYIETLWGRILAKAYVSPAMMRGVVALDAFWYTLPEEVEENLYGNLKYNFNVLIPDGHEYADRCTGVVPHRGLLCKVYKAPKAI